MKAAILTIGDEILIGQIVDTNSAYISRLLNELGIKVDVMMSISDSRQDIMESLDLLFSRVDMVMITGGLGPTKDDITKHVLAEYFGSEKMILDEATLQHVKDMLGRLGVDMIDLNRSQALVPDNCEVLYNALGTAPGMWFAKENKVAVSMPGVPYEMEYVMLNQVIPRLKERFSLSSIIHKTILTFGIPESRLANQISEWEDALPKHLHLAYLPTPSGVKLRISNYDVENKELAEDEVEEQLVKLRAILKDGIVEEGDYTMIDIISKLLIKREETVATAESCTGGKIASMLTEKSGSSAYFKGSIVSYANEVKENILNVNPKDIETVGVVSKEVVEQMAVNARKTLNTDYAISTSGIAGPTGGTPDKPVGTVWIAVASKEGVVSKKFNFTNNREQNIARASFNALNMLRQVIISR